jgi:hypothetical protein
MHRRRAVQGRNQTNQTRRLKTPSLTFGHISDYTAGDRYIPAPRRRAGAVNQGAVFDEDVVGHLFCVLSQFTVARAGGAGFGLLPHLIWKGFFMCRNYSQP